MKNLLSRLEKSLRWIEGCFCWYKFSCRHPEFISGSLEEKGMLKQVQHNDSFTEQVPNQAQYDGCPTGQAPNPVQYDDNRMERLPSLALHNGGGRTSFSFGRSMIEMLGVLSIVGLLSLAGLYGFRYGVDKEKANKIIEEVKTRAVACSTQLIGGRMSCDLGDFEKTLSTGHRINQSIADSGDKFYLTVLEIEEGICRKIASSGWTMPLMYAGSVSTTPMSSDNCAEKTDITFMFSRDLNPLLGMDGCEAGSSSICPNGSGSSCQGNYIAGYCGCRKCFSCEGYMGESYKNNCPAGQRCSSAGCVCESGGCPVGESNVCPDGASWVAGGKDNCNNQCYKCENNSGEDCTPACPSGSGTSCSGQIVSGGACGATGCRICFDCEGYLGNNYFTTCGNSQCTANGCFCEAGGCPTGTVKTCPAGKIKKAAGTDACGLQCFTCEEDVCSGKCQNGSICQADTTCLCVNGWSGDGCEICTGTINGGQCCLTGQVWNVTQQKCVSTDCPNGIQYDDGTCLNNACSDNSNCTSGEYCRYNPTECSDNGTYGTCEKIGNIDSYTYTYEEGMAHTSKSIKFVASSGTMDWWSVQNWCQAQGLVFVSRADVCEGGITTDTCIQSELRQRLYENLSRNAVWTREESNNSCSAYYVGLSTGNIGNYFRSAVYFALCR